MQSADLYRKWAAEMRVQAASIETPTVKEQFLKLAYEYDALAAQVGEIGNVLPWLQERR